MEVLTLSNSNFTGLSSTYPYDSNIEIKIDNYITYDGLNISLINGLSSTVDSTTNYYSNFVLSNKINIDNILKLQKPVIKYPYLLTTYLAIYTAGNVKSNSKVLNTGISNTTQIAYPIGFIAYDNALYNKYTINFVDNNTCVISQNINSSIYYFSYFQCNTGVAQFVMVSGYQDDENNLFNYYYDTDLSQLVLSKKVNGIQNYVSYINGQYLTMAPAVSGGDVYVTGSGFKIRLYNDIDLKINSDWYSYSKTIDTDGLLVNPDRCVDDIPLNYLLNFTPELLSNNSLPLNLIPFKNDKDNKNSLSRGSIVNELYNGVIQRTYTSLNTGTTQLKGSADFNTTYNSFTTQLLLPKDNITFFYFPYQPFPVVKLNINDSSLVESGAIAGDKPINSDKVFKHKVKEKFTEQYNTNYSEQTGTYLCSWLKGGNALSALPVWVDRYYDPTLIGSIDALKYTSSYSTEYAQLSVLNIDNIDTPVFDVTSNLTFEPGYQYAVQHLGDNNIIQLIDTLSGNCIQQYLNNKYDYLNQYYEYDSNIINLGKNYYSILLTDEQIIKITNYNNFTLTFDLDVKDWGKRIGYQILGNYNTYGLGIFNDQQVTPFIITYDLSNVYVYNTELTLLDSVNVDSNIIFLSKLDPVGNILTITENSYITRIDYNSVIVDKKYIPDITQYNSFYSTLEYTYCYSTLLSTIKINNSSLDYEYINQTCNQIVVPNVTPITYTLVEVNDILYVVPGTNVKSNKNKIFFTMQDSDAQLLAVYEIASKKASVLYITNTINDYIINSNNTIYLLYNNNMLLLTDTEYRIQTSNNFPIVLFTSQPTLSGLVFAGLDNIQNTDSDGTVKTGLVLVGFDTVRNIKHIITTNKVENGDILEIKKTVTQNVGNFTGYLNTTNYNFNVNNLTEVGEIEFRLGLPNVYDKTKIQLFRYTHDVSILEPGAHTFIIRFDSANGVYTIFIDGIQVKEFLFQGGQYSFSGIINKKIFIGNCIYYNNLPLGFYTNQPTYYITSNILIKNLYLYNIALSYYDILLFVKLNYLISDVKFELPTGKRNFVETIQQFFKFKVPGFKSNYFNVHAVNLPVTGVLKDQLDKIFIDLINKNKPGYTQLNKIIYHE